MRVQRYFLTFPRQDYGQYHPVQVDMEHPWKGRPLTLTVGHPLSTSHLLLPWRHFPHVSWVQGTALSTKKKRRVTKLFPQGSHRLVDHKCFLWHEDPLAKETTPQATGRCGVPSSSKSVGKFHFEFVHLHPCL